MHTPLNPLSILKFPKLGDARGWPFLINARSILKHINVARKAAQRSEEDAVNGELPKKTGNKRRKPKAAARPAAATSVTPVRRVRRKGKP